MQGVATIHNVIVKTGLAISADLRLFSFGLGRGGITIWWNQPHPSRLTRGTYGDSDSHFTFGLSVATISMSKWSVAIKNVCQQWVNCHGWPIFKLGILTKNWPDVFFVEYVKWNTFNIDVLDFLNMSLIK